MQLGLSVPWVSCGHDFGEKPPPWAGARRTDFGELERDLSSWRADGIQVARFWLLAGGVNYPVGRAPTWKVHAGHFRGRPVPPTDAFLADLAKLETACANAGMQLVPSLVSFEAFFPMVVRSGGVISGGLRHVLQSDPDETFDTLVAPMLEVIRPKYVRAFEICNEPDWIVKGGPLHVRRVGGRWVRTRDRVERPGLEALLVGLSQRVADAGFTPTVGFARCPDWLTAGARRVVERGLWQIHHYPTPLLRTLPRAATPNAVVGEFASAQGPRFHLQHMRWPLPTDHDPNQYLRGRLEHIRDRGYVGAWLWSARAKDGASAWTETQRAQVRAFTTR